jgi:hypothetical protein
MDIMNRGSIKSELYAWLSSMTMKYNWLQVKLEYKEDRGVFLVSFSPVSQIELSEEFNREAMQFADEMNAIYGNEARRLVTRQISHLHIRNIILT